MPSSDSGFLSNRPPIWWIVIVALIALIWFSPWLLFFVFVVAIIYRASSNNLRYTDDSEQRLWGSGREKQIHTVLALAAYLAKADRKVSQTEQRYVEAQLRRDMQPEYVERCMRIYENYLQQNVSLPAIAVIVNANYSLSERLSLIHFLVGLVAADGVLTVEEEHKLFSIARYIRVPYSSVRSILAMFSFQREQSGQSSSGQGQKQRFTQPANAVNKAYAILGIPSSTKDADTVKKAYRKMAKLHHPDRVAHLGPEYQQKAKEKFQQISDAYELLKKHLQFN